MARTNNLTDFLTDVSSAIKQKTGDSSPIPASEFDTEILSIETAGNYQSKILNITQNGNYNLLPDQEFDAISNVNISVSVSPVLQNKTITENGSYTADQNYDGLGTVIVNVPQTGDVPVKLFETQEEMHADPDAKEGDLALVYRSETQNATVDSQFQVATFPDTVVLDTAITDSVEVRYRAVDSSKMFDCWGSLDSSRFMMDCYTETGSITIQYESSDGITYTRIDDGEETVDFGTEIYYEYTDMWNDAIGCFIQINGSIFTGLYQYKAFKNKNKIHVYNYSELTWDNSTRKLTGTGGEVIEFDIESTLNKITEYTETNFSDYRSGTYYDDPVYEYMLYYDNNCIVFPFATQNEETPYKFLHNLNLLIDNTTWKATGGIITTDTSLTYNLHEIRVNITTGQLSYELLEEDFINEEYQPLTRFNNYKFVGNINTNGTFNYEYQNSLTTILYYSTEDSTWYLANCIYGEKPGIDDIKYLLADTQFNLNKPDELLPGKIAYGKNGVVTGDGTIYTQISNFDLFQSQGMDLLNNYTILATNTAIDKLGDVNTLETIACEYKKFDKPEELAEYDIHRIQNDTKYLAIKGGLEYRLYDLNFNLLDSLTFTEKQTITTLDSFMQNTSDLLLYQTTGTTTTHYRWIRITDTFEKIDYSIVGGTSVHIFAYHVFNNTLYLAFDNGGSYMYIYKLTTSGAASQLYKTSKAIDYTYQGFANFCEYEGVLYCSLVCNYNSTEYTNDVVKITSSGSTTAVYSGAYDEPMVVTVNGYAVSKNGTYRVTDFTTPVSTVSRTYSQYSNYIPYYDETHDAIIDYDYLYIGVAGSTFRRDGTLRTVIPNTASGAASSLITDISNYEVMTILNIPMEDGTKLSFNMMVYLNKGESDKGYKLIDLLNLETNEYRNLYLGCINTLQKQYDDTITPTEYNTAVDTANEILG